MEAAGVWTWTTRRRNGEAFEQKLTLVASGLVGLASLVFGDSWIPAGTSAEEVADVGSAVLLAVAALAHLLRGDKG